jgi:tRNA(fMet)-specific endonuclease VapC
MSVFVLDTNTLTLYEHRHPVVCQHVASHPFQDLAIITVEEQINGWCALVRKARQPDKIARAYLRFTLGISFLGRLPLLSYTESAVLRTV